MHSARMPTGNQKTWAIAAFVLLLTVFCSAFWLADSSRPLIQNPGYKPGGSAASNEQHQEKPKESWWQRATGDPIAVFTAVLTIFTGILAWTTWKLVRGAEDTAERQLRAYVSVEVGAAISFRVGEIIRIGMLMKNHGQTPAYKIAHHGLVALIANPLPAEFRIRPPADLNPSAGTLHPDQDTRAISSSRAPLSREEFEMLTSTESVRAYILGVATYQDIFGREWTTQTFGFIRNDDLLAAVADIGGTDRSVRFVYVDEHTYAT